MTASETEPLVDRNGRPLRGAALEHKRAALEGRRPRPGAAGADALRGQQIRALEEQNRRLTERIGQMEKVLGPAFAPKPRPPAPHDRSHGSAAQLWASDPDHDQRVTEVMLRPGATWPEINRIRAQVAAEYEQKAAERQQRDDEYHGRTGDRAPGRGERPMPTPPPYGFPVINERGVPVQKSTVYADWGHHGEG